MILFRRAAPALLLSGSLMTGCASIVHNGARTVTINSNPTGVPFVVRNKAGVEVAGGTTPATQTLDPKGGFFRAESYSVIYKPQWAPEQTRPLNSSLSGWYFGNIIFGGLLGMLIVDPATGAMWNLEPAVMVSLPQQPAPVPVVPAPVLSPAPVEAAAG